MIPVNAARYGLNTMDCISTKNDEHEHAQSRMPRARAVRGRMLRPDAAGTRAACAPCPAPGFPRQGFPRTGLSSLRAEGAGTVAGRSMGPGLARRALCVVVDRRRLLVHLS
ncbi:hypothetical protein BLAT2472_20353 [Burkholderia latens]